MRKSLFGFTLAALVLGLALAGGLARPAAPSGGTTLPAPLRGLEGRSPKPSHELRRGTEGRRAMDDWVMAGVPARAGAA